MYGPSNGTYYKVWGLKGRAAAYVKRELNIGQWDCETGPVWVRITLNPEDDTPAHIFNLYCEPHESQGWHNSLHTLPQTPPPGHIIMLGDFNLQHHSWTAMAARPLA